MKQKQPHIIDVIFVLALFGLFALSSLFLITAGAQIYHNTINNMQKNSEHRTSVSYLSEKMRQAKYAELSYLSGEKAIAITETINDTNYVTYLYFYDGYLRELLVEEDANLGDSVLAAGQKITELSSIDYKELKNGIIKTNIVFTDGSSETLLLNTHR